jgi:hypothetical protein
MSLCVEDDFFHDLVRYAAYLAMKEGRNFSISQALVRAVEASPSFQNARRQMKKWDRRSTKR